MFAFGHYNANFACKEEVCLCIPVAKLLPLFLNGSLHAEDFRCLDLHSKDLIRLLLLSSCNGLCSDLENLDKTSGHLEPKRSSRGYSKFAKQQNSRLPG